MDRIWGASKYAPKPFVTLCQIKVIQRHLAKKVKLEILSLGMIHVFGLDFRQEGRNDSRSLFEPPKADKKLKI